MTSTKTLRPKTLNRGADDERAAWMRKLRSIDRIISQHGNLWSAFEVVEELLAFGALRVARAKKRKGGL